MEGDWMIDTDRYEGHTEGPWYHHMDDYVEALDLDVPLSVCTLAEGEHKDANAQLIADAPLLLEEVKRLREAIVDMIDDMDNRYIRDIQHATGCLRDMIGYYEDEEE